MDDKPDQDLVAEVLGGNTESFGELAARHRPRIERLCKRFFSDGEMARDIAQESLIRAYTALGTYRAEMPFRGWLRAIVVNLCYDELRRRRRRPEELVGDFSAPEVQWMQLVNHATPEEIVGESEERREAHDLAHRLLDTLKPEDRMVMVLKESEELSISEIAATLGWSEAKVKIRAFRARQALRKQAERIFAAGRSREQ
ncbi:MAG: RNA polymerase sigma factor [Candidatus Binatus sp.]|uniref:RNA polymerase sigma factor n=1 Tax=Candidatus Binatus sp. TaxID=2811406 RepID=UPI0027242D39|nr:RNA polymerase sigma factor [Candidatus Binatus sp.]MDO8432941.1 RNA polymerase sigma factor [Candidatus Binatus sp.]